VDIRTQPMEVAPTAHHLMGGLKITPDSATTLPGLYACGEVTGGIHGANRLGGNALADTQVFGKRAGESAGKTPAANISVDIDEVLATEAARCDAYCNGSTPPHEITRELKHAMWDHAGIFRTKAGLQEAEATVSRLQNLVPKAADRRMLGECCTVTNMLTVARLIIHGAILREESRGAHVRQDITQDWTPADSPFGHTVQSLFGTAIEDKRGAV
jgi:fumarate reductase (CoM/CoB) subunit A